MYVQSQQFTQAPTIVHYHVHEAHDFLYVYSLLLVYCMGYYSDIRELFLLQVSSTPMTCFRHHGYTGWLMQKTHQHALNLGLTFFIVEKLDNPVIKVFSTIS